MRIEMASGCQEHRPGTPSPPQEHGSSLGIPQGAGGILGPSGTLAWCRSTPYMESFLAFSRKWISASPGVMPLVERK